LYPTEGSNVPPEITVFNCSQNTADSYGVVFIITTSDTDDATLTYHIEFGDGDIYEWNDSTGEVTTNHSYKNNTAAIYSATLTVTDSVGNTANAATNVICTGPPSGGCCN
jgi:hypothetical protein